MITLTVLNIDGKIHKQDQKRKRFRPLDGWERDRAGNFTKRLDDPRCISIQELKEFIQKRKKEPAPLPDLSMKADSSTRTLRLTSPHKYYTEFEFGHLIDYSSAYYKAGGCEFSNVTIVGEIKSFSVNVGDKFSRIELDLRKNEIKFFKQDHDKPTLILVDIISV